jgi:hypothetical protein
LDVAHGEFQWGKKAWGRLPCAVNSFPADTVVHARPQGASSQDAQQARTTLTPISQLQVSDEVLAIAEWKDKGSNPKQDQRLSYEKVTDIFTSFKEQTLIHLTLANGEQLTATDGHPFNTSEGWRDAILLKKGGKLLLPGEAQGVVEITQIAHRIETLTTYNLEVANAHTFFVGNDGVLVHNGVRPPNLTPPGGGRRGAHRAAKRNCNIPMCQQPDAVEPSRDRQGRRIAGRTYKYGECVIQEHADGHDYPDDPSQNRGPHFNDPKKRHYDY